ncbi:hypothetical protein Tco_0053608 [Tanacetum coccineum]
MSPVEYRTILKYRLMIPLFPVDAICPVCRKACLDSFGEHVVHCKELSGFKYRHDMVRDVLFYICRRVGISAKKEAPVNFLIDPSDGRSTLKPADVLVFGWVAKGEHARFLLVNLTGFSPLVPEAYSSAYQLGFAAFCSVAQCLHACFSLPAEKGTMSKLVVCYSIADMLSREALETRTANVVLLIQHDK